MKKEIINIIGMHCSSCEMLIEKELKKIKGVQNINVSHKKSIAEIEFNNEKPSFEEIENAIKMAGYKIGKEKELTWLSKNISDYGNLFKAIIIVLILYILARSLGLFNLGVNTEKTGILVSLFVGLLAGVSTCMALVGGLVLGLSARHSENHPEATTKQKFRPHLYFNLGRILGFTFFGGLIGLLGKAFSPTIGFTGFLTILAGIIMLFLGLKLIAIFPKLNATTITLPKGVANLFGLRSEIKEYSHKGSMLVGALTFFLPCGFTQAMQIYAMTQGSFWRGALVMGLFAIGTSAGLLGIGSITSFLSGERKKIFNVTIGLVLILFGLYNFMNGKLLLSGINSKQNNTQQTELNTPIDGNFLTVRMTQNSGGYEPNILRVEKNRPVKWIINSTSQFSCAVNLIVPQLGVNITLRKGENIITFTPTKLGEIPFSCGMGMYRGRFVVVDKL